MRKYSIIECVGDDNITWFMRKYRRNAVPLRLTSFRQLVNLLIAIAREIDSDPEAREKVARLLRGRGREDLARLLEA